MKYLGDEEGGKMVAVILPPTSSRIWIVISVVSLLVLVLVLVVVASIFWGVPGRVEEQEQVMRQPGLYDIVWCVVRRWRGWRTLSRSSRQ